MFDALHADVQREFRRTSWRDNLWAGSFGILAAPALVFLAAVPIFRVSGIEVSLDLQVVGLGSFGGRVGIVGIHWGRSLSCSVAVAFLLARWVRPKLHAWRMKRLWGN